MATFTTRTGPDGRLTTIDPFAACPSCTCEPEVIEYRTRTYTRPGGEPVTVRVGYWCTCGAVVIDGQFMMQAPPSRGDW